LTLRELRNSASRVNLSTVGNRPVTFTRWVFSPPCWVGDLPLHASPETFRDGVLEIAIPAPQAASRSRRLEIKDGAEGGRQSQTQASSAGTGS
jgi:hypothetical protein